MPALTGYGPIKCAASNTRLPGPCWERYSLVTGGRAGEGDIVLVEALADTGAYAEIENCDGRSERLYRGDRFLAVVGNRESSKYLCGSVPPEGFDLAAGPTLHLLSNGGIVGLCAPAPPYLGRPLPLRCHGVLADAAGPVNTIRRRGPDHSLAADGAFAPMVLVGASATDAGKTTLASRLVAALSRDHGLAVAAAKLAGTGCLEDVLQHRDAGARWIADFPDAGLPSTYTAEANYVPAVRALLAGIAGHRPDVVVAELGGDLTWANIPTLLRMADVMAAVVGLVVIPGDVPSAVGLRHLLDQWGVTAPVTWATPPNRNHVSFGLRMAAYVQGPHIDTRSPADIAALAARFAECAVARGKTRGD